MAIVRDSNNQKLQRIGVLVKEGLTDRRGASKKDCGGSVLLTNVTSQMTHFSVAVGHCASKFDPLDDLWGFAAEKKPQGFLVNLLQSPFL